MMMAQRRRKHFKKRGSLPLKGEMKILEVEVVSVAEVVEEAEDVVNQVINVTTKPIYNAITAKKNGHKEAHC